MTNYEKRAIIEYTRDVCCANYAAVCSSQLWAMYYIKDFNELNPGPQTGSLTSMYEGGINYERYENIKITYKCFSLLYIIIFLKLLLDIHFSTSASCCHVLYRSICELLTLDQVFLFGFLQVKNDQGCVIQIVKTQLFLKSQPTIVLSILELAHLNLLIIKARGNTASCRL